MKISIGAALGIATVPMLILTLGVGSASAQPASGNPPPPKGFEADSASFVSAQTGFVLGARGCSRMPCTARLEMTADGGKTWTSVSAPAVSLVPPFSGSPSSAVSSVRFENASDGWLFGPALWATTDGGTQWRRLSLPGHVVALAASDGVVFAAAAPAIGGLDAARLYESQVGTAKWKLVSGVSPAAALTVFGHSVWAGIAPKLWTSTDSGKHWSKLSFHCPQVAPSPSAVAAASTSDVSVACSDQGYPQPGFSFKEVFTSANGGRTFHLAGSPAEPGQVGMLAMPQGHAKVITLTASSGASYLYRSVNGGKAWGRATYFDGGLGFRDLAYASATTGYVIHFSGGPVIAYGLGLMKTANAGATWKTITIP
ncbi:MAG: WD40/YVTN/BNR-like repeat-containing protein [Streptosporangiaceae bacterium]